MKLLIVSACVAMTCITTTAFAQASIAGTYNGDYEVYGSGGQRRFGITLVINSVEDGKVKGSATLHQGSCRGEYPVEGTVKDDVIGVRSTAKGGTAGDCSFGFKGKVDGNRLVGNMGKYDVVFRK
jgi:hypothetical protein